jgi:hypothetical protein
VSTRLSFGLEYCETAVGVINNDTAKAEAGR